MHRYLLRFYKKGNMRYISHLDLQRLFQRAIRRGEIEVAYSKGYNPHELINIVQPLALGLEGMAELFELDTVLFYDPEELMERMNRGLPEGIGFYDCVETPRQKQSSSCITESAVYEVEFAERKILEKLNLHDFMLQSTIRISKYDKKRRRDFRKDVGDMIKELKIKEGKLMMKLSCAPNATLNPLDLLTELFDFSGMIFSPEKCRITRTKLCKQSEDE